MKNFKKLIIFLVMALVFTSIYINNPSSAVSSDSYNVTKMLDAYKKGNYKTADKYAKKIKSTKYDASESKMTGAMTKAYANVLLNSDKEYLSDGAYFVDMDGDNKVEMILPHGIGEADEVAYVYKYKNNKAVYVGQFDYGHSGIVNYPGHKGLICWYAHMDHEIISTIYLKNGKIKSTVYGDRYAKWANYISLKPLYNHYSYDFGWSL